MHDIFNVDIDRLIYKINVFDFVCAEAKISLGLKQNEVGDKIEIETCSAGR